MSYTFLQEQGEESSAECFSGIPASVLSRLSLIAERSYFNGSGTGYCQSSQSGMMSGLSTENRGEAKLTEFAEASPAKTYQHAGTDQASTAKSQDFGEKCSESLVRYNLTTSSWRIPLSLFDMDLPWFSVNLPNWGTMRDGAVWEHPTAAETTTGKEPGYWPTPVASDWHGAAHKSPKLNVRLNHFCFSISRRDLEHSMTFREWLMGWPIGWTDLQPLETDKFQQWLDSHGMHSPNISAQPPQSPITPEEV
jgi:hypothetical protein